MADGPLVSSERELRLEREAEVLFAYLTGRRPSPAARAAYLRAHAGRPEESRFTRGLLALMARGRAAGFAVDSYSSVFRDAELHRKLVLVLAIDEASPPASDRPAAAPLPPWRFAASAALRLVGHACVLALCAPWLLPWHGLQRWARRERHGS